MLVQTITTITIAHRYTTFWPLGTKLTYTRISITAMEEEKMQDVESVTPSVMNLNMMIC